VHMKPIKFITKAMILCHKQANIIRNTAGKKINTKLLA